MCMHQYACVCVCVCAVRAQLLLFQRQFVMSLLCVPADGDRLERLLHQACFHLDRRQPCVYECVCACHNHYSCGFFTHKVFPLQNGSLFIYSCLSSLWPGITDNSNPPEQCTIRGLWVKKDYSETDKLLVQFIIARASFYTTHLAHGYQACQANKHLHHKNHFLSQCVCFM